MKTGFPKVPRRGFFQDIPISPRHVHSTTNSTAASAAVITTTKTIATHVTAPTDITNAAMRVTRNRCNAANTADT